MSERDPLLQQPTTPTVPTGAGEPASVPSAAALGPLDISRRTRYGILAGLWAATFLSSLNTTLVATLLSSISSEFDRSNQASWLGTAFLLATCTFTPLYGRLSNVLGRRGASHVAVFFAALGTLLCGLSTSLEMLVAARFIAGLGAGGVFTIASIITSDLYSMRARGLTQGIANVFNGLGMGLGGPIGGLIADKLGWRWAFLIQLPLFAVSFLLTSWNLHYVTPGRSKDVKDVLKRIDYAGTLTLFVSVLCFLIFLSERYQAAEPQPFVSLHVLGALVGGIVSFLLFILAELLVAREPVLAPWLLRQRVPLLVGTSNMFVAICNFSMMYFFPLWFETVCLDNASVAGAHMLPHSISMSIGSLFAGWAIHRTGRYKMLQLVCGTFTFAAALMLVRLNEDSGWVAKWFSILPAGFGNAVVLQTTLIALLAHVPQNAMAVATGFGQVFRGVGQVAGVAISSAVFQSVLARELRARLGPGNEELVTRIRHSATLVAQLPPAEQRAARDSYGVALRLVFMGAAIATALAYIARIPIPERSLDHNESKAPKARTDNSDDEERPNDTTSP